MTGYGETALVKGMSFLADKQAAIANNLANVDTASFKRRSGIAQSTGDRFASLLDRQLAAVDYVERSDMQRGVLRETGNRLDVAIDGSQWMRVQDAQGRTFLTRNGQLAIGNDGRLMTRNGLTVLDTNGRPISFGTGEQAPSDVSFASNGTVTNTVTGQVYGTLALVEPATPSAMTPVGASLYSYPQDETLKPVADGLQQGYLEGSNVDSLHELVEMIAVERSFSATQRALTGLDRLQSNMITNMLR